MKTFNQKVHDFWFEEAPAARLALLRILIGAFTVWYLVPAQDNLLRVAQTDPRLFAPVGVVFHGPIGLELFQWLVRGTLLAAVCFTLGLWHRIVGPVFAGLLLWLLCYRNSWSMIYHTYNLLVLHVIVLALTRSADVLSLDSFLRNRRPAGPAPGGPAGWQYGWPIKLTCALTVTAYFVTAVAKLAGPLGLGWMTGSALRSQMAVDGIRKELFGAAPDAVSYALYDWLPLFSLLAVGSFALEFLAPLALLHRRVGRFWAINTFLMHWGILVVMHITFGYQLSGVMFASFFRLERLLELPRRFWGRRDVVEDQPGPSPAASVAARAGVSSATLFYDGDCGLCNRFVQFVLRHDRQAYFQFTPLQSEAGREQLSRLGLATDDLETVVLVEEGKSHLRSSATLRVCRRLGGLWPLLYVFILIPKVWRDAAYSLVARNRKRWFKAPLTCPVMPSEWRRRFVG